MKIDLAAAAAAKTKALTGSVRATWTGGKIEIDEVRFLDLVARAIAVTMGNNLFNGRRTDGSGNMPARKYDGRPRGTGALIARALAPLRNGPLGWLISAHREKVGHLARLMGGIPFLAPPLESIRAAVHNAFLSAVTLSQEIAAGRALPRVVPGAAGADARQARRASRAAVHARREHFREQLGALGFTGKTPERSALGKRIRSASRAQLRVGR